MNETFFSKGQQGEYQPQEDPSAMSEVAGRRENASCSTTPLSMRLAVWNHGIRGSGLKESQLDRKTISNKPREKTQWCVCVFVDKQRSRVFPCLWHLVALRLQMAWWRFRLCMRVRKLELCCWLLPRCFKRLPPLRQLPLEVLLGKPLPLSSSIVHTYITLCDYLKHQIVIANLWSAYHDPCIYAHTEYTCNIDVFCSSKFLLARTLAQSL